MTSSYSIINSNETTPKTTASPLISQALATEFMDPESKMEGVRREVEAMLAGLDDDLATTMIEFCQKITKHIEINRAKKLRVWKEFYEPPRMNDPADKHSAEYKQKIVDKYYQLGKRLPALEKLRALDLARKIAVEELNFQVLMAEEWEKREDSKKAKETRVTGGGPEDGVGEK